MERLLFLYPQGGEPLPVLPGRGASSTDVYTNLALERALLDSLPAETGILYLWENRRTVVVGRNQNCWRECRVSLLEEEGGFLARRLSGGGAVYHDRGNLNFSFLFHAGDYDVSRQTGVVLRALKALGIPAESSGRNDLTVEGRKVSGSAFYRRGSRCVHHGTLLADADPEALGRYLTPPASKRASGPASKPGSKPGSGTASVRARTANLTEWNPSLSLDQLAQALREALEPVYGLPPTDLVPGELLPGGGVSGESLEEHRRFFASPQWRYSRSQPFSREISRRFPWGEVVFCLDIRGGLITGAEIYSDGLAPFPWGKLAQAFRGIPASPSALRAQAARFLDSPDILEWLGGLEGGFVDGG